MQCIERKLRLSGEESRYECELLEARDGHVVLRYVIDRERSVGGVVLPAGTITLALYHADRSYNLYYWLAPGDPVDDPWRRDIAYYFNIAEPLALGPEEVAYRDLVVDVLVLPDGTAQVLDQEELPAALEGRVREIIDRTRVELLADRMRIIDEARSILRPYALEG